MYFTEWQWKALGVEFRFQYNLSPSLRSTFACNRVHPNSSTKWVIKDNDNVVVAETEHGLFYSQEAYVVRWSYRITVVKELEGLSPGSGMFARERKMQQVRLSELSSLSTSSLCLFDLLTPANLSWFCLFCVHCIIKSKFFIKNILNSLLILSYKGFSIYINVCNTKKKMSSVLVHTLY